MRSRRPVPVLILLNIIIRLNALWQLPPGVASINKTEKIIIEDGDKKRVIKIIKIMEDGSKQIETVKEILEE